MPKLIIDNIPAEVPQGTSVLEAARSVGITIPHFCYHPALAIAAACRLCAVKVLEGRVKGIQMSCSLPAEDGMVISTTDREAVELRLLVIEWLMINHPHDCPVCDEGGECLLQDFTIAGGHSRRRYQGKKRTHMNQYLGEGIYHEMNRCIQCYRCVRFYQEYAGGTDFGVTGSAGRVYFGRFADGQLESPFSGNLVDICPTGVFTDKTGRYRARYWDYDFAPSICPHCSVGCNTAPQCYQREVIKIVGRRNDHVNGWFICDRGRFDKGYLNDKQRPRDPMIDGSLTSFDVAVDALAGRISDFINLNGTGSVAFVGSTRVSLESAIMLGELALLLEGASLCYYTDPSLSEGSLAAVQLLNEEKAASVADIMGAERIVLLSLDLMEEGAMLAPAVRKASLQGAAVYLVAPQDEAAPQKLPFAHKVVSSLEEVPFEGVTRSVAICGAGRKEPSLLARIVSLGAKLVLLQPGPNAFGTALLAIEHDAQPLSELVDSGRVKAVVAFEADIPAAMLERVTVLGCADWRSGDVATKAGVFLPTTTWVESAGTAINFEGRAQRFQRAMRTGLPLRGLDPKYYLHDRGKNGTPLHPPRVHRREPPGGEPRDCWEIIAQLMGRLGGEQLTEPLFGKWANLKNIDPEGGGVRVLDLV